MGRRLRDGFEVEREAPGRPVAENGHGFCCTPKIALSASRDIPFNKLLLSACNVRRIKAGVSIEQLADDIARRTLLQSLTVRPGAGRRRQRDRHVRDPGRRPPLPGAGAAGQAEAPGQDGADPVRDPHRRHRRGGQPGRERPARAAASARPVPRLPGAAREGPVRGGDRRGVLRLGGGGQAAAAAGVGVAEAAGRLRRGRHDAGPAHGLHRLGGSGTAGAGLGAAAVLLHARSRM